MTLALHAIAEVTMDRLQGGRTGVSTQALVSQRLENARHKMCDGPIPLVAMCVCTDLSHWLQLNNLMEQIPDTN